MRSIKELYRTLLGVFLLTFIAIMYVNQQVLVYQMGLNLKENYQIYSKLVDRNRILVYNVLNLKSPLSLETRLLSKKLELNMPRKWQVVRLDSSTEKIIQADVKRKGIFASLFSVSREAEASPNINSNIGITKK